jgi:primosomal protein N' (replication factor Y)
VSLTLHRRAGRVRCHYCNFSVTRPSTCAHCAGPYLDTVGFGTERLEADVADRFPGATIARLDRDAARRRGAGAALLARFREGDIDVLVGTQMIAKGHDFPNVTLVGVVSADAGLQVADFRAAERTFQLLTQVAGRAGRGVRPGSAILQSFHPEHYSIVHACRQAYGPFFEEEMRYRTALHYPPVLSMVNAVVRGRTLDAAMRDAARVAGALRAAGSSFQVLGPAVAPIARLRGQHRAQIFLKGRNRHAMRIALRAALDASPDLGRRVTVDVDPINLL